MLCVTCCVVLLYSYEKHRASLKPAWHDQSLDGESTVCGNWSYVMQSYGREWKWIKAFTGIWVKLHDSMQTKNMTLATFALLRPLRSFPDKRAFLFVSVKLFLFCFCFLSLSVKRVIWQATSPAGKQSLSREVGQDCRHRPGRRYTAMHGRR